MNPLIRILSAVILVMKAAPALSAAVFTWDGGDLVGSDWSAGNNWATNTAPATDGTADLIFTGTTRLAPVANLNWSIRSLAFSAGAGGFVIQGNPLTIGVGGIVHSDDSVQTIQNDLVLAAAQIFRTTSTGSFSVNGSIDTNGNTLTVDGSTRFILLGGAITGTGGLTSIGVNSLVLTGESSNTYTGITSVSGNLLLGKTGGATAIPGTLIIGGGAGYNNVGVGFDEQIADTSTVTIGSGASLGLGKGVIETVGALSIGNGTVRIDTGWLKTGSVAMTGGTISSTAGGRLILNGNLSATGGGLTPSTIAGRLDLAGTSRTLLVADAAEAIELEVSASIFNGSLVKTGAGTLRITGAQTYSALLAQAGAVTLETALGTGASSVTASPIAGIAKVNLNTSQRLAALTIGNGGVVNVGSLPPSPAPEFPSGDLGDFPKPDPLFATNGRQSVPEAAPSILLQIGATCLLLGGRRRLD